MVNERRLARELLNAVYDKDLERAEELLDFGADANWIFNGYPILHHAVCKKDRRMVKLLIERGAVQIDSALAFAQDRGLTGMVLLLHRYGASPKHEYMNVAFGYYPNRYAPIDYQALLHP
ncbi:ankyrin repeat domain-containing protein [[Eubacterium] hominis]|uniref:ankyrin repeat domain-containing protein n=1 Tax=[Eubacterium] hominis TaxID=2764325 RepID=UPI003A4D4246